MASEEGHKNVPSYFFYRHLSHFSLLCHLSYKQPSWSTNRHNNQHNTYTFFFLLQLFPNNHLFISEFLTTFAKSASWYQPVCRRIKHLHNQDQIFPTTINPTTKNILSETILSKHRSRLNFYEIQDLPLFLRRFWALKRECSELHDRWKGKKRPKRKVKIEFRRDKTSNQIFVRKV